MSLAARIPPQKLQPATLADLLALPDEGRGYEIIDGEITEKQTSPKHGGAQSRLSRLLGPYDRRPGGRQPGGWWFATEVTVEFEPKHKLRPDVAGWRRERMAELPTEPTTSIIPDWIGEILSPANARNDTVKKKRVYHRHQVAHYWLLDPIQETLQVLRWTPDGYTEILSAERGEKVRAEPFADVELPVGVFFGEDEDE